MIDTDFGYFECGLDSVFFQVLVENTDDDGVTVLSWDQDASGVELWDHWYAVHDQNRDGAID